MIEEQVITIGLKITTVAASLIDVTEVIDAFGVGGMLCLGLDNDNPGGAALNALVLMIKPHPDSAFSDYIDTWAAGTVGDLGTPVALETLGDNIKTCLFARIPPCDSFKVQGKSGTSTGLITLGFFKKGQTP